MEGNIDWSLFISIIALLGSAASLFIQWKAHQREKRREERDLTKSLKVDYEIRQIGTYHKFNQFKLTFLGHNSGNHRITVDKLELYRKMDNKIIAQFPLTPGMDRIVNGGETITLNFRFRRSNENQISKKDLSLKVTDIDGSEYSS